MFFKLSPKFKRVANSRNMCVRHPAVYGTSRPVTEIGDVKFLGASTQTPPNLRHDLEEATRPLQDMSWPSPLIIECRPPRWFLCMVLMISGLRVRHPWSTEDLKISISSLKAFSPLPYTLPGWNQVCWYWVPPYRRLSSSRGRCSWRVSTQSLS